MSWLNCVMIPDDTYSFNTDFLCPLYPEFFHSRKVLPTTPPDPADLFSLLYNYIRVHGRGPGSVKLSPTGSYQMSKLDVWCELCNWVLYSSGEGKLIFGEGERVFKLLAFVLGEVRQTYPSCQYRRRSGSTCGDWRVTGQCCRVVYGINWCFMIDWLYKKRSPRLAGERVTQNRNYLNP